MEKNELTESAQEIYANRREADFTPILLAASPLRLLLSINSDSLYSPVPSQRKAPATQAIVLVFGQTIPK